MIRSVSVLLDVLCQDERADCSEQRVTLTCRLPSLADSSVKDLFNFYLTHGEWFELRPAGIHGHTQCPRQSRLDRKLVDGSLCPSACKWADWCACVFVCVCVMSVVTLTFTGNSIWKWEGATENADCSERSLWLLFNWLAVTHFMAVKHSLGHFLNYAETYPVE